MYALRGRASYEANGVCGAWRNGHGTGAWQPIGDAGSDAKTAALGALALNQYLDISIK